MFRKVFLAGLLLGFTSFTTQTKTIQLGREAAKEIATVFKSLDTKFKYNVFAIVKEYDIKTKTAKVEIGVDITNISTAQLERELTPLFKAFRGTSKFKITDIELPNYKPLKTHNELGLKVIKHGTLLTTKPSNSSCILNNKLRIKLNALIVSETL